MEDYALDIMAGKGPSARSIRLSLPHFTLVGATTRAGMLTSPLRDRFGVICRLELYSPEELARIVERSAGILGIKSDKEGCMELARRSRWHSQNRQPSFKAGAGLCSGAGRRRYNQAGSQSCVPVRRKLTAWAWIRTTGAYWNA